MSSIDVRDVCFGMICGDNFEVLVSGVNRIGRGLVGCVFGGACLLRTAVTSELLG